nr:probable LRR receptor-like serine/threonine-protein kinase At3g47570 [Aegilops tauschii subsp. strangulata]
MSNIDRHALLCFKSGISSDPLGILHSWSNGSLDFCSWKGVACGTKFPPRVASLNLTAARLGGQLSGCVCNLTFLSRMNLANNHLLGTIPEVLGKLPNLHTLNLAGSNLQGSNTLVGQIPSHIGYSLSNLQLLILGSNRLNVLIPASLANMLNLQILDLSNNSLHGSVPSLGSLSNLHQLDLGRNLLEAHDWSFLTSLANCTQLTKLSLERNALNGSLPISIVNLSRRLEDLSLGSNQISGSIPVEIGNLVNLFSLGMESNFLSGSIPSSIGKLRNLYILNLSKNKLSGQIPPSIGDVTQLSELHLDGNNLSENIPGSLAQCMGLFELNLSQNNLDGSISVRLFADLLFAWSLDFSHNNLTGELPPVLGTYGIGSGLLSLHIEGNRFHGQIPERWHLLVSTRQLNLSHNGLSGVVPKFFEQLDKLEQLDLSYNNLEGVVPASGIFTHSAAVVLDGNKGLC